MTVFVCVHIPFKGQSNDKRFYWDKGYHEITDKVQHRKCSNS